MTRPSPSTPSIADPSGGRHDVLRGETANDIDDQPRDESESATRTLLGSSMPLRFDSRSHFIAVIQTYAAGVEEQRRPVRQQHKPTKH